MGSRATHLVRASSTAATQGKAGLGSAHTASALPCAIRIVSYNVYFGEEFMTERTLGICDILFAEPKPHIVCLQEVTKASDAIFRAAATREGYTVVVGTGYKASDPSYYCALLLGPGVTIQKAGVQPFRVTAMDRHLVFAQGTCEGQPFAVSTSHLESMPPNARRRAGQFEEACAFMTDVSSTSPEGLYVFCGDTNFEEGEIERTETSFKEADAERKEPLGVSLDVWRLLGEPADTRYTWDMAVNDTFKYGDMKPRIRYDRMFLFGEGFKPVSLALLGTERLPCGAYPSDHWGLAAVFEDASIRRHLV